MADDPFSRAVSEREAKQALEDKKRAELDRARLQAVREQTEWLNELAPRFAAEARRKRKPGDRGRNGQRPFMFHKAWRVSVSSPSGTDGHPAFQSTFFIFPNGQWRLSWGDGQRHKRLRPSTVQAGLTYDDYVQSFARFL